MSTVGLTKPMRDEQVQKQRLQGLVRYDPWGSLDLPPAAFLPEFGSAGVLKGGDNLVNCAAPSLTICIKCRPLVVVNVTGSEGLPQNVSLMPICHGSQWRVHHTELSWASDGLPILEICPAHRCSDLSNMASMLVISTWSQTSTLET